MSKFNIFVIRAILGAGFAVFLTRFFFQEVNLIYVAGLGVFMVGMAYVLESWRNRKSDTDSGR